jgi:hypothetical protein
VLEIWAIPYMVIDTSNWWVGKSVLIAPEWKSRISWLDRKIYVNMTRASIEKSPGNRRSDRASLRRATLPSLWAHASSAQGRSGDNVQLAAREREP